MSAIGRYRLLFTPLALGPVVVRNRIVFSAHLTNYAEDGRPSEQHAAYYEARAAGGAGLIITEEHSTHPTDWPYEKMIHGFDPAVVPGYRRITDAVHRNGTPIFAQINHNGGQGSGMYSRLPALGALGRGRPAVPRGAQGGRPGGDRRDRRRLRAGGPALRGGRVRRRRAPVLPLLDRARLSVPGHQPPNRRLRREPREPQPPPPAPGACASARRSARASPSASASAGTS